MEEFSKDGEFLCRAGCDKAKRDNGHISPTIIHTAIIAGSTPSPQSLRDSSPIIMVFASKLRENRFVKFISFDDGEHSCYNFGS